MAFEDDGYVVDGVATDPPEYGRPFRVLDTVAAKLHVTAPVLWIAFGWFQCDDGQEYAWAPRKRWGLA